MKARSLIVGLLAAATAVAGGVTLPATAGAAPADNYTAPEQTDDVTPMIVGGTNASQVYSFMVSLQNTSGSHFCGGSLIKANWVVTAKHCVQGKTPSSVRVRVGTTNRTSGGSTATGSAISVHPSYDIALLKLATNVPQATIPVAASSGAVGTATRIIGWGQTCPSPGGCGAPVTLQELNTSIVADSGCSGVSATYEICTGNPGGNKGACYGDSGGPEIKQVGGAWQLIGATSRSGGGSTCAVRPSIYMDVPAFRTWISGIAGPV